MLLRPSFTANLNYSNILNNQIINLLEIITFDLELVLAGSGSLFKHSYFKKHKDL